MIFWSIDVASSRLFLPIGLSFAGNTAAGSGTIVQWTYTVPAGKRSVLTYAFCSINVSAAAAATTTCRIITSIGGVQVTIIGINNPAVITGTLYGFSSCAVDLSPGDTVTGVTSNTSAVISIMTAQASINEFGS